MADIRRTRLLGQPLNLPGPAPDRVEAYRVEMPPGQPAGRHLHPGPVTGYVESGEIAYQQAGQPERRLSAGDVFLEPAGETILRFDNASESRPAVFVAFYLISGDQPLIQPLP